MKVGRPVKLTGHSVDVKQFENINTKEVAYFLGFLWADGSIYHRGYQYRIEIEIAKSDGVVLSELLSSIGHWNVQTRRRKVSKQPSMKFSCNNRFLYQFLYDTDYGYKSTKPPSKILDKIPTDVHHYFWRGYLDGDGCIYLTKKLGRVNGIRVNFWGTYRQDWTALRTLCASMNINVALYKYDRIIRGKHQRSSTIYILGSDGRKKLLDYIFQGEPIGLTRKMMKYQCFRDGQPQPASEDSVPDAPPPM